ncbi:MAG: hypothetical protein K9J79_06460 [Desulfobacteraceae bacterium]|nr:hypothetical protein [Desulfobacteraceae bacterium]MCF8094989.1 hypothetical protein [Desulfobacteraceae bacterium]
MMRKMIYAVLTLAFALFAAAMPTNAMDMGVQSSLRLSPISVEQSMVGARIDKFPYVFTPKGGFGISDEKQGDTLKVFTIGCGLDYYLSEKALKPYAGADVLLDFIDDDNSDSSLSIIPHIGAEYWPNKNFSFGADIGLQVGFGDYYNSEFRFGTASTIHATYYFGGEE